MKELDAKKYAFEKFKLLSEIEAKWNYIHSLGLIRALNELDEGKFDMEKLRALAWIHDIGKVEGEENHAQKGVAILEKDFELDEIDRDCIANHGSSSKPMTEEGKLFRYCDGLSLFYSETILFRFYGEGKEGNDFEKVKDIMQKSYEKYIVAYADSDKVVKLLKQKYNNIFD